MAIPRRLGQSPTVRGGNRRAMHGGAIAPAYSVAPHLRRRGSVLLLVLVVVAMLTLGTATYLELMQHEHQAVRHHGRAAQAVRLAESGVEYAKTLLALTPVELVQEGGLASNSTLMQAIVVDDQPDDFDRGMFTLLAPAQSDGRYSGVRYGLENESAKLNLNVLLADESQAASRLLALRGMTAEIADAILDWIDDDEAPRAGGAEQEYYSQLSPPYAPRNAAFAAVDELLLVRGVTPELLYGLDANRNMLVDDVEEARGALTELDNATGEFNRGWAAYLTVASVEAMQDPAAALPDLNGKNLQQLHAALKKNGLDEGQANFIVIYRQYGAAPEPEEPSDNAADRDGNRGDNSGGGGTRQPPGAAAGQPGAAGQPPGQQTPVTVTAAAVQVKFEAEAAAPLNSPLDLVGVKVQVPGGDENSPPQIVESPWQDDTNSYRDLLELYDAVQITTARRVAGRVNVNAATRPVLRSIPGLAATAIDRIISRRESEPDPLLSDQRHAVWLLVEGVVKLDEMRALERYVTTRGDVFSGQSVGFFAAGPIAARGEFILDRSGPTPRLRAWRDLSSLGRGFSGKLLGAQPQPTP